MALVLSHLSKSYPTRSGDLPVLRDVSLTLQPGEILAIMGPSGSGKSTLLHVLGTLDPPTSGTLSLNNVEPFKLPEAKLAEFRNRQLGFVFQDHHLLPQLNVLENVLAPTFVAKDVDKQGLLNTAKELLNRVGLSHRLDHRPAELSGGERQRVAIARSLILSPKLLLADEPTGNLDRTNSQGIGELLLELHRERGTILVVVTHSPELARAFPRTAMMDDGRFIFS
jgi:lipoprotein-releasing system ATP-binding protein